MSVLYGRFDLAKKYGWSWLFMIPNMHYAGPRRCRELDANLSREHVTGRPPTSSAPRKG